ncbi:MAG: NAD+ synthase [Bacteroidota bacterium]
MKIALAQLNYITGDFEGNTRKICDCIALAKKDNADLVVFAELSVCGYPPRDFLAYPHFIDQCEKYVKLIAEKCEGIAAVVGAPSRNSSGKGKHLYNSAYFLNNGKIENIVHKTLLPTYDVFDEYRYFEPNNEFHLIDFGGEKIALTICEDLWNTGNNPLYRVNPMDALAAQKPTLMINIAASPFDYTQAAKRKEILKINAAKYNLPLVYVNHWGAQTDLIFDGGSMMLNADAEIVCGLKYFEEDFVCIDTKENQKAQTISVPEKTELVHDALVLGIRDYFKKLGFTKAILGLSGGIDSAVVAVLAAEALGAENVKALLLPSSFSSDHSVTDALELAKNLNIPHETISIAPGYTRMEETLQPYFQNLPFGVAEENLQARLRAMILMAFANKFGFILLNTSNKSEAAVGYGTLYGDMCGGISVIGDVYKTDVYALANYINRNQKIIPENIITKAPSAELRPNQKDSDSLPEYDLLDQILECYIEKSLGLDEIVAKGFDESVVRRVLKMVNDNEWKRHQAPPILRVSPRAFGMGRRMPIAAKYLS